MPIDNPKLDQLRKSTVQMLIRLYSAAMVLDSSITVAPDLDTLRRSKARHYARATLIEFGEWIKQGTVSEEEAEQLRSLKLPAFVREDAEMR